MICSREEGGWGVWEETNGRKANEKQSEEVGQLIIMNRIKDGGSENIGKKQTKIVLKEIGRKLFISNIVDSVCAVYSSSNQVEKCLLTPLWKSRCVASNKAVMITHV